MSFAKPIRVLCVDDHPVVRDGLVAMIGSQQDMIVVAEAADGESAVKLFRELMPDVTLMDLHLPGISGVSAMKLIRAEFPKARIIVLTTFDGDEDVRQAIDAGARGYLLKESLRSELLDAIRAVHQGGRSIPDEIGARLAESLSHPPLTPRELDILREMALGLRNGQISSKLGIGEETVRSHVKSILAKLEVADRGQAIVTALRRGLLHTSF